MRGVLPFFRSNPKALIRIYTIDIYIYYFRIEFIIRFMIDYLNLLAISFDEDLVFSRSTGVQGDLNEN